MALKYSKQRELIKDFLMTRKDHPTADVVYMNVKQSFPNISLGTVYRNLTLLCDLGEIQKIQVGDGVDHFDPDTSNHYHFKCNDCGCVSDLELENMDDIITRANAQFGGRIQSYTTYFNGLCDTCYKN